MAGLQMSVTLAELDAIEVDEATIEGTAAAGADSSAGMPKRQAVAVAPPPGSGDSTGRALQASSGPPPQYFTLSGQFFQNWHQQEVLAHFDLVAAALASTPDAPNGVAECCRNWTAFRVVLIKLGYASASSDPWKTMAWCLRRRPLRPVSARQHSGTHLGRRRAGQRKTRTRPR
ncbi:unnamed protein product [Prorocentrum cordatum]|uniref:Uncharacterized protein n=1 Tax=Prorocentrum cordatum TaxID=2364126 RepID=A0ABN9YHR0_9DINO|nr:unnamed protein product [Polarella glacialis]